MDPNEALEDFLAAVEDGDYDKAQEFWEDLSEWLAKGGFEPDWEDFDVDEGHASRGGTPPVDVTREWFDAWRRPEDR